MNARILCPGPSLAHYDAGDFAGLVLGVNRAACRYSCDVWCAGDLPLVRSAAENVIGSPVLFTTRQTRERFDWRGPVAEWETLGIDPAYFSMLAAVRYAAWHQATIIDIFGCDWTPEETPGRSAERWERERRLFDELTASLPAVEIRRNGIA